MRRTSTRALALAVSSGLVPMAGAQVIINEVFENPPNGGDQTWEYIELYGPPGYDLTGYAVALVKGGEDNDPADDVPDGSANQRAPEIDEAFSLDGWQVGPDGFFVLYNVEQFGFTGLDPFLIPNPDYQFFFPESPTNKRFLNGASFETLHIPSVDTYGRLSNDGSSTYMLVRRRPNHEINAQGQSVYHDGYAWKKDVSPDVDFNSRLDFGDEHTRGVPIWLADGLSGDQTTALEMEPVQVVDEVAWSNAGGKEYNIPGRGLRKAEFSETPGFNPDCLSRVRYLVDALLIGSTINENTGELSWNSIADDSWIYGETLNVDPGTSTYTFYKPLLEPGPDAIAGTSDDELNLLTPVDPDGPTYSYDGLGDDNPLSAPFFEFSGARDPNGILLFEPHDATDFEFTPGAFNDATPGTPLDGTAIARQFRYVRGDANFDGVVNLFDYAAALDHVGMGLDDQTRLVRDFNTDDPSDDVEYTGWKFQVQAFNTLLTLIRMDLTDGTTGEWNSGVTVTEADAAALRALLPSDPDVDADGSIDINDLYEATQNPVDLDGDGDADLADAWHLQWFLRRHEFSDIRGGRFADPD